MAPATAGANTLITGNSAANVLDGQAGADTMSGGAGDDTYVVDNAGDVVIEASQLRGRTSSAASIELHARCNNAENLVLVGSTATSTATGNSAGEYDHRQWRCNNRLDGGAGVDAMAGGLGNDTYVVDNSGDVVSELSRSGDIDTVESSDQLDALGANVDNLTLTGLAVSATGNAAANRLTGNGAAAIVLDGAAGADTMAGGAGNDTYYVDNAGDVVTEAAGEGTDRVEASSISWFARQPTSPRT